MPSELNKLSPLLNITSWKKDELFSFYCVSSNGIRTWRVSDWLDVEIGNINHCIFIEKQLTKQGIAVEQILVEWKALKRRLPTLDIDWEHPEKLRWEDIIKQVLADDFINLVCLVDFLGTFSLRTCRSRERL